MSLNNLIQKMINEALVLEAPRYKQEIPGLEPLEDYSQRQNYWHLKLKQYEHNPNAFVTFSTIPKLGINPKNTWGTPTGIYGYPLDMKKTISDFATNRPYALVFKPKNPERMLTFFEYDSNESFYQSDVEKLKDYFQQKRGLIYDFSEFEKDARENAKFATPSAWLWNLTRLLSEYVERQTKARRPDTNIKSTFQWSQILYNILGYEGAYDNEGIGLIHENEPFQAVFFRSDAVELLELINKTEKEDIHAKGQTINKNIEKEKINVLLQQLKKGTTLKNHIFDLDLLNIKSISINFSNLEDCNINSSQLKNNKFFNSTFSTTKFVSMLFMDYIFENCEFQWCDFNHIGFQNCSFTNCKFIGCNFNYVNFYNDSKFDNNKFEYCNLYRVVAKSESFFKNDLDVNTIKSFHKTGNVNSIFDENGFIDTQQELEHYAQTHGLTI